MEGESFDFTTLPYWNLDKENIEEKCAIQDMFWKMDKYLSEHNSICVGVSGGSDSNIIVHIIATYFREHLPKIHFVFQNTGLEYRATLRHLTYMEQRYNIKIDRIRGESVVKVIREKGVPIVSKEFSTLIYYANKQSKWALERINRTKEESKFALTPRLKRLADYLVENKIQISSFCCDLSKKRPYKKYLKEKKADLNISGERRYEGGQRATAHKTCFERGGEV